MHVHTNDVIISQSNSIANNKTPSHNLIRPSLDAFCPFGHQQGLFRNHQKPKPHISNIMKNVVSYLFITNSFAHITHSAHAITLSCCDDGSGFGFGDDRTDPADESKRTQRIQEWSNAKNPMENQWQPAKMLVSTLKHFEIATKDMSADNACTAQIIALRKLLF